MNLQIIIILLAVALALIIAVWRFSNGRYGKLHPNGEVARAYESFQVNPMLNYYLSGPDLYPNALMGMDKDLILMSNLWKKKDLSPERMKELVQGMQTKALENLVMLQGFYILDHKDRRIGNWLSIPGLHVMIRIKGENSVEISTPPGDIYGMT